MCKKIYLNKNLGINGLSWEMEIISIFVNMKVRVNVNYIFYLINEVDEKFVKNEYIIEEIIRFYKGIMGIV